MNNILNLIFPERHICFICEDYGKDIEDNLCSICREKLVFIKDGSCSICGRKLDLLDENLETIKRCGECIKHPHYFTKSTSPLSYEGDIKRLIYDFKYNDKQHMYKLFGKLIASHIINHDLEYVDLIVSVPLHKDREKKRGFNQTALLAKYVGRKLNIITDTKNLIRSKKTKVQNKLNRSERISNISGVFDLRDKDIFKDKNVLLIDDIYTTGSTVDEISKLLLKNGVKKVFVVTVSITPNE